jgi:hypothetical protein
VDLPDDLVATGRSAPQPGLPAQDGGFGVQQCEAAPDEDAGRLAPLGQIADEPADERRAPWTPQGVRAGEQSESATFLDDLGSENPLGDEESGSGQIECAGIHPPVRADRVNRHFGPAVSDQSGNGFHRRDRVPRLW